MRGIPIKVLLIILALTGLSVLGHSQTESTLLNDAKDDTPQYLNLGGDWDFLPLDAPLDQITTGKYDSQWGSVAVPGYWSDAQILKSSKINWSGEPDFTKSTTQWPRCYSQSYAWYRKRFYIAPNFKKFDARMVLSGVKWTSDIWMNGKYLGSHVGGYAPFEIDVSKVFKVGVDNEVLIRVGSWLTIPRNEKGLPQITIGRIQTLARRPAGITGTAQLKFYRRVAVQSIFAIPQITGNNVQVRVTVTPANAVKPGDKLEIYLSENETISPINKTTLPIDVNSTQWLAGGEAIINIPNARYWWPWRPYLYSVTVMITDKDNLPLDIWKNSFGLREFKIKDGNYYLNNQRIQLRGSSLLDDAEFQLGTTLSLDTDFMKQYLIDIPKANKIDVLRSPAAPINSTWLNYCDAKGMMVISDFPVAPLSNQWEDTTFGFFALQEYRELLPTLWNHPSIILWSMSNRSLGGDKQTVEDTYVKPVIEQLDPSRPVIRSGANSILCNDLTINDGMGSGTLSDFRSKIEATRKSKKGQILMASDFPSIDYDKLGYWRNKDVTQYQFGTALKITPEDMQIRQAEIGSEQAEILRVNQFNGIFPVWYPDWINRDAWIKNIQRPPVKKTIMSALQNALSPVAVIVDLKNKEFKAGQILSVPVKIANDSPAATPVTVELMLLKENPVYDPKKAQALKKKALFYDVSSSSVAPYSVIPGEVMIPLGKVAPGTYYLTAVLTLKDTKEMTLSQRRIQILEK